MIRNNFKFDFYILKGRIRVPENTIINSMVITTRIPDRKWVYRLPDHHHFWRRLSTVCDVTKVIWEYISYKLFIWRHVIKTIFLQFDSHQKTASDSWPHQTSRLRRSSVWTGASCYRGCGYCWSFSEWNSRYCRRPRK